MDKFSWVIVDKNGKAIAGASDREKAETIAKTLGGVAKENALAELTGELSYSTNGVFFTDESGYDTLQKALGKAFDSQPTSRNPVNIGYVTITIKAATKPEPEDPVSDIEFKEL